MRPGGMSSMPDMKMVAHMLENGVALSLSKLGSPKPGRYAVWLKDRFLGLGTVEPDAPGMKLKRF